MVSKYVYEYIYKKVKSRRVIGWGIASLDINLRAGNWAPNTTALRSSRAHSEAEKDIGATNVHTLAHRSVIPDHSTLQSHSSPTRDSIVLKPETHIFPNHNKRQCVHKMS